MARKVIQLTSCGEDGCHYAALCDDGTMWRGYVSTNPGRPDVVKWTRIDPIPQEPAPPAALRTVAPAA
jgi:hypothetical protein